MPGDVLLEGGGGGQVDNAGNVQVNIAATSTTVPVTPSVSGDLAGTLTDGRKVVTTAGTRVALTTTSTCKWVAVTALGTNSDVIFVGGSAVVAAAGTEAGTPLLANNTTVLPVNDPAKVYIDSRVNGEGVSYTVGS